MQHECTAFDFPSAIAIDCFMNASLGLGAPSSMASHSPAIGLLHKLAPRRLYGRLHGKHHVSRDVRARRRPAQQQ